MVPLLVVGLVIFGLANALFAAANSMTNTSPRRSAIWRLLQLNRGFERAAIMAWAPGLAARQVQQRLLLWADLAPPPRLSCYRWLAEPQRRMMTLSLV